MATSIEESASKVVGRFTSRARTAGLPSDPPSRLVLADGLADVLRRGAEWLRAEAAPTHVLGSSMPVRTHEELAEMARELRVLRASLVDAGVDAETAARLCERILEESAVELTRHQAEEIRKLEDRSRLAIDAAELALWELDLRSGKRWWSDRAAAIMDFATMEELMDSSYLKHLPPEDLVRRDEAIRVAVDPTGKGEYRVDFKAPARKGDTTERWISTMGRTVFEDGKAIKLLGTLHDITERKRDEAERDLLVGALGHDLRNPLASISLGGSLMSQHADPTVAAIGARLLKSTARMARMIDDLLDFARLRSRGIELHPGDFDLARLCREVVEEFRHAHPQRTILLEERGETSGCWDRDRLAQVLQNLIANAVTHGSGEGPILVNLVGTNDDAVQLAVVNRGSPIAPDLLAHMFEPFKRGSQQGEGLGLGLYIVRRIVDAHGGTIEVTSTLEQTRFDVAIPRTKREGCTPCS